MSDRVNPSPGLSRDAQDELIKEVKRLRLDNQVLRAHCSKYQGDIVKLKATVNALEQEKKANFSFVINNLLQHSQLSLQVMPHVMRRDSGIAASPERTSPPQPIPRRILSTSNSPPHKESPPTPKTMNSGRPRRKAAPKNLKEKNLVTKQRR